MGSEQALVGAEHALVGVDLKEIGWVLRGSLEPSRGRKGRRKEARGACALAVRKKGIMWRSVSRGEDVSLAEKGAIWFESVRRKEKRKEVWK